MVTSPSQFFIFEKNRQKHYFIVHSLGQETLTVFPVSTTGPILLSFILTSCKHSITNQNALRLLYKFKIVFLISTRAVYKTRMSTVLSSDKNGHSFEPDKNEHSFELTVMVRFESDKNGHSFEPDKNELSFAFRHPHTETCRKGCFCKMDVSSDEEIFSKCINS
ncbi:hypothetical protein AVEN_26445-1 [Araneus ventricosus]|uniref:Uncharacterized protein n=1 Tax=Araneus ventricosus TaxID=182803 RepID=A0A4Y2WDX7_ARAVE|nr:hypothetical protein AVEN_26445-1 [Araneus ventricosus]